MHASETPKAPARQRSRRPTPAIRGRHSAVSTTAANATRRNTVPPGPASSNTVLASPEPNCTEPAASSTRATGGTAAPYRRRHNRPVDWESYERAFAGVEAPFALVDLDALWANAADMLARARGKPIRVASKSVRCRGLLEAILRRDGFRGLMTFTLAESLWLHSRGFGDLLLAYPTADRAALSELGRLES